MREGGKGGGRGEGGSVEGVVGNGCRACGVDGGGGRSSPFAVVGARRDFVVVVRRWLAVVVVCRLSSSFALWCPRRSVVVRRRRLTSFHPVTWLLTGGMPFPLSRGDVAVAVNRPWAVDGDGVALVR